MIKELSIPLIIVCLVLAMLVVGVADRATEIDRIKRAAEESAETPKIYKSVKLHGRTYNFFVVEIDGEEYVVGSDDSSITMVRKGAGDGKLKPGVRGSDGNLLPEGR